MYCIGFGWLFLWFNKILCLSKSQRSTLIKIIEELFLKLFNDFLGIHPVFCNSIYRIMRLLLIEDDIKTLQSIRQGLEENGYEIDIAYDGLIEIV